MMKAPMNVSVLQDTLAVAILVQVTVTLTSSWLLEYHPCPLS